MKKNHLLKKKPATQIRIDRESVVTCFSLDLRQRPKTFFGGLSSEFRLFGGIEGNRGHPWRPQPIRTSSGQDEVRTRDDAAFETSLPSGSTIAGRKEWEAETSAVCVSTSRHHRQGWPRRRCSNLNGLSCRRRGNNSLDNAGIIHLIV